MWPRRACRVRRESGRLARVVAARRSPGDGVRRIRGATPPPLVIVASQSTNGAVLFAYLVDMRAP